MIRPAVPTGRVWLNVEVTADEEQITIFTGHAEFVDRATIRQELLDRNAEMYTQGMLNIKMSRAEYEAA